ncbi:AbrB family transcriptional regulator [Salinigranum rubrum]|uniref:AbrB family transcriptional regulator n=1 Tax=Salinigranum rubrum TaxID=755307 RepID=A0A2I8VM70_9EURY|nr:phosphate uptake regulator PhoU [Salinigranum rubrum]AUV83026.1 AbrB family transcriptional regulator [Salinigranum rubrum]
METRKLQEVGGGTYTVSIPKEWAIARGLEAGTPVNLYSHLDGSIVVRSREKDGDGLSEITVEVDGSRTQVERALRAAQAVGFERVTLVAAEPFDAETCRAVRSLVRQFVGTELVDERDGRLVVRNLLDASDVSVRQSVVQLQYVALSIHERATTSFLDTDPGAYEQLRGRETEVDRLCGMVVRHFGRALVSLEEVDRVGASRPDLFEYYETARRLERVARNGLTIARVGRYLADPLPEAVVDELETVASTARGVVEGTSNAVLEGRDSERVHEILDTCVETRDSLAAFEEALADDRSAMPAGPTADVVAVARSLDALRRTLDHGSAIGDVALQGAMRRERL